MIVIERFQPMPSAIEPHPMRPKPFAREKKMAYAVAAAAAASYGSPDLSSPDETRASPPKGFAIPMTMSPARAQKAYASQIV